MKNKAPEIAEVMFIKEIIDNLTRTTKKQPYTTNALTRLKVAMDAFEKGKYKQGSL